MIKQESIDQSISTTDNSYQPTSDFQGNEVCLPTDTKNSFDTNIQVRTRTKLAWLKLKIDF